jgi:UDP:flavonoid glycosyltransferase YjiC (YdhE family)
LHHNSQYSIKIIFCHAGLKSIHESLYTGIPMLVPFGGDQMGNTQKLESAGVVLSLDKFTLDVNDLVNKMSVLLEDAKIKKI